MQASATRHAAKRTLLSCAASATPAVILAAGSAVALAAAPDPHPGWLALNTTVRNRLDDLSLDPVVSAGICAESRRREELISTTPARTLAGARAQLALVRERIESFVPEEEDFVALENAMATLERLAGETRHA